MFQTLPLNVEVSVGIQDGEWYLIYQDTSFSDHSGDRIYFRASEPKDPYVELEDDIECSLYWPKGADSLTITLYYVHSADIEDGNGNIEEASFLTYQVTLPSPQGVHCITDVDENDIVTEIT